MTKHRDVVRQLNKGNTAIFMGNKKNTNKAAERSSLFLLVRNRYDNRRSTFMAGKHIKFPATHHFNPLPDDIKCGMRPAFIGGVKTGTVSVSAAETPEAAESSPASATDTSAEDTGEAPDYSQEDCWLQIPEITKDIDTFYIYSTVYIESSFEEGASAYAELDNPEMILGASGEYVTNASAFEDSTNVFVSC